MNTHSDGWYGTLLNTYKRKTWFKIGVSYASCGPTSCQGGCKESERDDVVSLYKVNSVRSCHTSSFIIQNKLICTNNERGFQKGDSQYLLKKWGTQFPWTKH